MIVFDGRRFAVFHGAAIRTTKDRTMSNTAWIEALADLQQQGEPCVLVTIIEERGSTPRNAGSKMVVSRERLYDTIGGGHLEYKAQAIAREMLENRVRDTRLERFSLGASLGQCCGGATVLLFEPMGQPQAHIAVFGAGHVGRALVPLLASLPCKVRWIDSRESEFPAQIPAGVEKVVNDEVVDEVAEMPAGSYFIVMTHNHQLDLELTAAILERNDFTYYGLIGSKSKRAKFEHRLRDRGFQPETVQRMRCPMGIAEVKGKLPVEIAVSIAGEVIAIYNANFGEKIADGEKPVPMLVPASRRSQTG
jgi:xanthine dehydrogenase accessory factor